MAVRSLKCFKSIIDDLTNCKIQITNTLTGETKDANAGNLIEVLSTMISRNSEYSKMFNEIFLEQWIKPFMPEKTYNVISFLLLNRDRENCIFATAETIAKHCDTTLITTQRILKDLIASQGIKKIQNGVYQINLDAIFSGKASAREQAKIKFTKDFKYTCDKIKQESANQKQRIARNKKRT